MIPGLVWTVLIPIYWFRNVACHVQLTLASSVDSISFDFGHNVGKKCEGPLWFRSLGLALKVRLNAERESGVCLLDLLTSFIEDCAGCFNRVPDVKEESKRSAGNLLPPTFMLVHISRILNVQLFGLSCVAGFMVLITSKQLEL